MRHGYFDLLSITGRFGLERFVSGWFDFVRLIFSMLHADERNFEMLFRKNRFFIIGSRIHERNHSRSQSCR
jgi:hypothetical protein